MCDQDSIRVVLFNLPTSVHGFTVCDESGFYTVVLNSRLSHEKQCETYAHEVAHIMNGDFSRMQDINRDLFAELTADQIEGIRHE